jgi:hypothetical protein
MPKEDATEFFDQLTVTKFVSEDEQVGLVEAAFASMPDGVTVEQVQALLDWAHEVNVAHAMLEATVQHKIMPSWGEGETEAKFRAVTDEDRSRLQRMAAL